MTFDVKAPKNLKTLQQWFAGIITRPLLEENRMNPISPAKRKMAEEAPRFIVPSPTMKPDARIELYNQQYWWRLLKVMQESYPLLTRLFGPGGFNEALAVPYLVKNPPVHWSLSHLGDRFPYWVDEAYHEPDRALVLDSARLDWAFGESFISPEYEPIRLENLPEKGELSSLLNIKLHLQPHVHLFAWTFDLKEFRSEFLKQEPEYWIDNDFPPLKKEKEYRNVLYRNCRNFVVCKEVSKAEYATLMQFKRGASIEDVCAWLEDQEDDVAEEAAGQLQQWFKDWIVRRWLYIAP